MGRLATSHRAGWTIDRVAEQSPLGEGAVVGFLQVRWHFESGLRVSFVISARFVVGRCPRRTRTPSGRGRNDGGASPENRVCRSRSGPGPGQPHGDLLRRRAGWRPHRTTTRLMSEPGRPAPPKRGMGRPGCASSPPIRGPRSQILNKLCPARFRIPHRLREAICRLVR